MNFLRLPMVAILRAEQMDLCRKVTQHLNTIRSTMSYEWWILNSDELPSMQAGIHGGEQ